MHRTASLNEESARYSELASDFYVPDPKDWALNTTADKQATVKYSITEKQAEHLHRLITRHDTDSYTLYQNLLNGWEFDTPEKREKAVAEGLLDRCDLHDCDISELELKTGIAREQARMVLGVNIYTQCIWKCDLKNLLHYLRLRTDAHAQYEIRVFADAIARVTEACFPIAWKSFKDNFIDGVNFSKAELDILGTVFTAVVDKQAMRVANQIKSIGWTARRWTEFAKKLRKTPFVTADLIDAIGEAVKQVYAK